MALNTNIVLLADAAKYIDSTPIAVLRGFEAAAVLAWAFGFFLVFKFGGTKFLIGIYLGTTSWFMWDWIFTDDWFLNLRYDRRSILLYTLDGRPEPLWSPLSYGFFFGIAALVFLRYQWYFRKVAGRYIVVLFPMAMALLDLVVEGSIVSALKIYSYGYRESWKIWNIPYTNLVWVVIIQTLMVITFSAFVRHQHRNGVLAVNGDPNFRAAGTGQTGGVAAEQQDEGWLIAVLTFSVTAAAVYIGTAVMAFILAGIHPWS